LKVLILGAGGQVGRELARARWPVGWSIDPRDRAGLDILDPAAVEAGLRDARPDLVVNAAAYTAVDRAESEPEAARAANAEAPGRIAAAAAARGAALVHVSTDYVFDGTGDRPWREDDPIRPVNVYGRTKAEGEERVRAATAAHVVLRTSWVFAAHGSNFVRTMIRLAGERSELRVVDDQRGGPTAAAAIAAAVVGVAGAIAGGARPWGTYHFAGTPDTTWAGFAEAVFAGLAARGMARPAVVRVASAEYPTPAARPANSMLDCDRYTRVFGRPRPDWRADLAVVLDELLGPTRRAGAR